MLNFVSLVVGLVAMLLALVGLIPLLGWVNWAAIPFAVVGGLIGALGSGKSGRNLNIAILLVAIVRL